jgi:pre-mRNA-splicing factor RBM22/SLT11
MSNRHSFLDLPVQVRDTLAGIRDEVPRSDVNKQYYIRQAEAMFERGEAPTLASQGIAGLIDVEGGSDGLPGGGKAPAGGRDLLRTIARGEPYYKRNRQHLCSFYAKGQCTRGDECPYRHELPVDNELAHQNIKDRYHGTNDPVANKMLGRAGGPPDRRPKAPEDKTLTSLYLQGVESGISDSDLRDHFLVFGEVRTIAMLRKSHAAFVTFATREGAERAVEQSFMNCQVKGHVLRVAWGRPKTAAGKELGRPEAAGGLFTVLFVGFLVFRADFHSLFSEAQKPAPTLDELADIPLPPPPGAGFAKYASQDPNSLGNAPVRKKTARQT